MKIREVLKTSLAFWEQPKLRTDLSEWMLKFWLSKLDLPQII
jgi:hypothetical protein